MGASGQKTFCEIKYIVKYCYKIKSCNFLKEKAISKNYETRIPI